MHIHTGSVIDIDTENGTGEPRSNSGLICCVHFRSNAFDKGINPALSVGNRV